MFDFPVTQETAGEDVSATMTAMVVHCIKRTHTSSTFPQKNPGDVNRFKIQKSIAHKFIAYLSVFDFL